MHPAHLPTRYAATYAFYREDWTRGRPAGGLRRRDRHGRHDEPATARALSGHLLRGLDCGALDRWR